MVLEPACGQTRSRDANKQLEILDGILTELAIQNSEDVSKAGPPKPEGVQSENGNVGTADSNKEHPVCH